MLRNWPIPMPKSDDPWTFKGSHVCTLPIYWTPYVPDATKWKCPVCTQRWMSEDGKWCQMEGP